MTSETYQPDEIPDVTPPEFAELDPNAAENMPDFELHEARATTVMEVVLPFFLDAGRAVMENTPDAQIRVYNLLAGIERNSAQADEGDDGFWRAASTIIRAVLIDREDAMQLVKRSEELDKHEGFSWKTLCVMCYLGGSMDTNALPRMSVMLHMAVAEYVHRHVSHNQPVYEQGIVPWFAWFWERSFENAKFRFYAPRIVAMDLRDALKSPMDVRWQRILRAASFGLWEPIPEKGRAWFQSAEDKMPAYLLG